MSKAFLIVAVVLLTGTNAVTRSQGASPDAGETARLQNADKAFEDAERALTIRLLDKAIAQADADVSLLKDVQSATHSLTERLSALRTSNDGKRLAASLDELSAEQVSHLIDEPPVRPDELATMGREIASVSSDLKALRADPPAGFVPPEQQQDELMKLSVSLRNMLARTRERDRWLTALMSAAPKQLDVSKMPTLDAALSDFRSRQQQAWNAAQLKGIQEAVPQSLQQITEAARVAELERSLQQSTIMLAESRQANELARIDADMQLRLIKEEKDREVALLNKKLAESAAQRGIVDAQANATLQQGKADAEKVRLRQKCETSEVRQLLAPFITVGLWQPGDNPGKPWIHDRGPVSLSALKKCGALEPTDKGLTLLYIAGNGSYVNWPYQVHPDKERPKWGFPGAPSRLRQDDWQKLRHIQDLLNELGETMVELKMLGQ